MFVAAWLAILLAQLVLPIGRVGPLLEMHVMWGVGLKTQALNQIHCQAIAILEQAPQPFGDLEHSHQPNLMLLLAPSGIATNYPFCHHLDQSMAHHLAAVGVAAALEECCCCCQTGTALVW